MASHASGTRIEFHQTPGFVLVDINWKKITYCGMNCSGDEIRYTDALIEHEF